MEPRSFVSPPGDNPPHHMWDETQESQFNCTKIVMDSLTKGLPDQDVFCVMGNHGNFECTHFIYRILADKMIIETLEGYF